MMAIDEDAMICDLAETYGILDYRSLPLNTVATLAAGLRDNSRIKMKVSNETVDHETMLLAAILDGINTVAWLLSEDGRRGTNRPISVVNELRGDLEKEIAIFASAEEYEWARASVIGGAS